MDGFISGYSREKVCSLERLLYIVLLKPTHTSHSPTSDKNLSDRIWLTSSGRRRLNSSVAPLQWPLGSLRWLYVVIVVDHNALPLSNVCCHVEAHTVSQEFTRCQNKALVILKRTPCDSCGGLFLVKSVALIWLCQPIGISASLRKSMTKHFFFFFLAANTAQALLPSRSRTRRPGSGGKKEHALWMLSRCLQSGLYSQRTLYSCSNAFQDAGTWFTACLMDCTPTPTFPVGLCTFWPWCQQRQTEAAE